MIWFVLGFILGLQLGFYGRTIKKLLLDLRSEPLPPVGVTRGSYNSPHTVGQSGAIVQPKSPQQVEFEARRDLEELNKR